MKSLWFNTKRWLEISCREGRTHHAHCVAEGREQRLRFAHPHLAGDGRVAAI